MVYGDIESIVDIHDVFVSYETASGKVMALRGVDLKIGVGDRVIVSGPSGSGKTTLLKLILGEVKPVAGRVKVFGLDPSMEENLSRIRSQIGYCSQEGYLINKLTVMENIDLYLNGRGIDLSSDEIMHLANTLNIDNVLDKLPTQLSGGELKRAELLMILLDKPKLLLLDEPTAMLDTENVERVISLLKEFDGLSMAIATHDRRLYSVGNRLVELVGGEVVRIENI
ncbi:TPA: ATP-binding cassette domain-containing protein [Candidatus Geothermarchaeota archaeon]|nr:ATP-binding cassette domain-containing protein [Candidatus Geothermarchaeota archaeon]HIQ13037.1 ATP-binding cassette domain-containing protein [Thermoprotei archaeon]